MSTGLSIFLNGTRIHLSGVDLMRIANELTRESYDPIKPLLNLQHLAQPVSNSFEEMMSDVSSWFQLAKSLPLLSSANLERIMDSNKNISKAMLHYADERGVAIDPYDSFLNVTQAATKILFPKPIQTNLDLFSRYYFIILNLIINHKPRGFTLNDLKKYLPELSDQNKKKEQQKLLGIFSHLSKVLINPQEARNFLKTYNDVAYAILLMVLSFFYCIELCKTKVQHSASVKQAFNLCAPFYPILKTENPKYLAHQMQNILCAEPCLKVPPILPCLVTLLFIVEVAYAPINMLLNLCALDLIQAHSQFTLKSLLMDPESQKQEILAQWLHAYLIEKSSLQPCLEPERRGALLHPDLHSIQNPALFSEASELISDLLRARLSTVDKMELSYVPTVPTLQAPQSIPQRLHLDPDFENHLRSLQQYAIPENGFFAPANRKFYVKSSIETPAQREALSRQGEKTRRLTLFQEAGKWYEQRVHPDAREKRLADGQYNFVVLTYADGVDRIIIGKVDHYFLALGPDRAGPGRGRGHRVRFAGQIKFWRGDILQWTNCDSSQKEKSYYISYSLAQDIAYSTKLPIKKFIPAHLAQEPFAFQQFEPSYLPNAHFGRATSLQRNVFEPLQALEVALQLDEVKSSEFVMSSKPIAAGSSRSLFLNSQGRVWTCGLGPMALGYEEAQRDALSLRAKPLQFTEEPIIQIVAGYLHSLFMSNRGDIWAYGANSEGQLGLGTMEYRCSQPTIIKALANRRITQITAGGAHTLFLEEDGSLWGCGNNQIGALGMGCDQATYLKNFSSPQHFQISCEQKPIHITQIVAGHSYSLFLSDRGEIFSCGKNMRGELGLGSLYSYYLPNKIKGAWQAPIHSMAAGYQHSLFLTETGEVWGCGSNDEGQLGLDSQENSLIPQPVRELKGHRIIQVAAGYKHSLFLTDKGLVFTCGRNSMGQLGLMNRQYHLRPTLVAAIGNQRVIAIAAGFDHSLFFTNRKEAWMCGLYETHINLVACAKVFSSPQKIEFL